MINRPTKAIWKHGPFFINEPKKVRGYPMHFNMQDRLIFVWTEVCTDVPPEDDIEFNLVFVPTGQNFKGAYCGTVKQEEFNTTYMWHCIELFDEEEEDDE